MDAVYDAVPVLRGTRIAVPVRFHRHNFDLVADAHKNFHASLERGRLITIHFHVQLPEVTLRTCIGTLLVLAQAEKLA